MNTSIFLARVLGWFLVIISIFLFTNRGTIKVILNELIQQKTLRIFIAMNTLMIGLLLVVSHNIWVIGWPLIVTIISWLILITGILRLFAFDHIVKYAKKMTNHPIYIQVIMVIYFIIGLVLLYKGYYSFKA